MLKFDIETSSSAVAITKPINQPVCRFKISRVGLFSGQRVYAQIGEDLHFTIGWVNRFKSLFWGSSIIQVNGKVPAIMLQAKYSFLKMVLCDQARGIEIAWHSANQYVVRNADHELARIYIYKASFGFTDYDNYVLTVLDEDFDLTLLFLYVFCFKFAMAGDGGVLPTIMMLMLMEMVTIVTVTTMTVTMGTVTAMAVIVIDRQVLLLEYHRTK